MVQDYNPEYTRYLNNFILIAISAENLIRYKYSAIFPHRVGFQDTHLE